MKIKWTDQTPGMIQQFAGAAYPTQNPKLEEVLTSEQVDHVAEIFQTPLTGSYNWNYTVQDDRIKKLYDLGKQLNWDPEVDINWDRPWPEDVLQPEIMNLHEYPPYLAMDDKTQAEFWLHMNAWSLSQFLHGEQGALLVASQLVSCAPTYNAKLYAASQTFDEARHVEVFNKYLQQRIGVMYPINSSLKSLLDKILTDPRWDMKFIGMQIVIEGLALSAFNTTRETTPDPVLKDIVYLVIRDEARHVTFGVNYLEEFVKGLSEQERDDRAMFAYEACVVARERLVATDVFRHFGWDVEEARKQVLDGFVMTHFRKLLFQRVIPNLARIGLLTDKVRPKFEGLGILEYENLTTDGDIDWAAMERPLDTSDTQAYEQNLMGEFAKKLEQEAGEITAPGHPA